MVSILLTHYNQLRLKYIFHILSTQSIACCMSKGWVITSYRLVNSWPGRHSLNVTAMLNMFTRKPGIQAWPSCWSLVPEMAAFLHDFVSVVRAGHPSRWLEVKPYHSTIRARFTRSSPVTNVRCLLYFPPVHQDWFDITWSNWTRRRFAYESDFAQRSSL